MQLHPLPLVSSPAHYSLCINSRASTPADSLACLTAAKLVFRQKNALFLSWRQFISICFDYIHFTAQDCSQIFVWGADQISFSGHFNLGFITATENFPLVACVTRWRSKSEVAVLVSGWSRPGSSLRVDYGFLQNSTIRINSSNLNVTNSND